jgi:hypothetical protein
LAAISIDTDSGNEDAGEEPRFAPSSSSAHGPALKRPRRSPEKPSVSAPRRITAHLRRVRDVTERIHTGLSEAIGAMGDLKQELAKLEDVVLSTYRSA